VLLLCVEYSGNDSKDFNPEILDSLEAVDRGADVLSGDYASNTTEDSQKDADKD